MGRRLGDGGVAAPGQGGRLRRLRWPLATSAAMMAVTVGLGVWQVQRLAWKTGLLAEIDRSEAAAPQPLPPAPLPFQRVVVHGRYLPGTARYGAEVRAVREGPVMGAGVVNAIQPEGGPPVIVDRGWAPEGFDAAPPPGVVDVVGYVRPAEHAGWLSLRDEPGQRRYYTLDPGAIGTGLGLAAEMPFTLVALGPAGMDWPEPATALPRPPNDHLSYAITWFSLSAALAVVLAVYVRQTVRQGNPP